MAAETDICAHIEHVSHAYGKVKALVDVSLDIPAATTIGLVGPDGVGKSTLLSLIAGVKIIQSGQIQVLDGNMANRRDRHRLSRRVAFMPQGLGHNLYPTLSIYENIDFHAHLFAIPRSAREKRINRLLDATELTPFRERPAGKLSGGMKQKLSLCCALVHDPDLLILDEPTTGVDPLSRRQFWQLIDDLRGEREKMTVLVSTAYIEEAEQFNHLLVMNAGEVLVSAPTRQVIHEHGDIDLATAYNQLLPEDKRGEPELEIPPFEPESEAPPAIQAKNLTKKFGNFTAVDKVSFTIEKGEIFGFLGSNGCGKSTTMKMLTGLLDATEGSAQLLGSPVEAGNIETRMQVGYMSQAFSLYEELSVRKNLKMHAKLYRLPGDKITQAVDRSLKQFDLEAVADTLPRDLSLGIRQRLQLAAACLHQPKVLILDEPTSGVDPAARDMFWKHLISLSRQDRITIFVSTHFMSEATRCDRISFMHRGQVLAMGTPEELTENQHVETLEESFIRYLEQAIEERRQPSREQEPADGNMLSDQNVAATSGLRTWLTVLLTFSRRESKELLRDPVRMFFSLAGPVILMLTVALAISFDIRNITFSVYDQDQSVESRTLVRNFEGSPYFTRQGDIHSNEDIREFLRSGRTRLVIDIPPNFGRDLMRGQKPEVNFNLDGAFPFTGENIKAMIFGIMTQYGAEKLRESGYPLDLRPPVLIVPRYVYNQDFKSIYGSTPGVIMLVLMLVPVMMTALGVVREKELGSISNLYTSPASVPQYLIGKQLPYVAISLASYFILVGLAIILLGVPVKGSFPGMTLGALLLIFSITSFGLFISSLVDSQVAAMFASAVAVLIPGLNFSGLFSPISTITGPNYLVAVSFPASWYHYISMGAFTKGLGISSFLNSYLALLGFALLFLFLATCFLKKQER